MVRLRLLLVPCLALLAGCNAGPKTFKFPISGGEMVSISFNNGTIVPGEDDDFKIELAQFQVNGKGQPGVYLFRLWSKKGAVPRSVKVEDVSENEPVVLLEDAAPKLTADRRWICITPPVAADRENLRWVFEIESCFRIYRFTIGMPDGRAVVLYQACSYPDFIKAVFRQLLGLEEPPHAN